MRIVEPKIFFLAATELDAEGTKAWLEHLGGLQVLDHLTGSGSEQLIELAARRCYKSFAVGLNPNVTKIRTDSEEYHDNILSSRHGSVLAHAHVTFAFEDVSRVFTHELCRNETGTHNDIEEPKDKSQESLRYVRLTDLPFWIPPEIIEDSAALSFFKECILTMEEWQKWLADHFQIDSMKNFSKKKKLTSTFRRLVGMGVATGIVFTHNIRSLRWVIEQRTDYSAEHEIRLVYNQVCQIAIQKWPFLFSDFVQLEKKDGVPAWKPDYSKV